MPRKPEIEHVFITNFKCFEGAHRYGPFNTLTAMYGTTGAGKSIIMEAIAYVFGELATNLGADNDKGLISEKESNASVTVVLLIRPGVSRRFSKMIVQQEDEDGNYLQHILQFFLDDDVVCKEDFEEELERFGIVHDNICHVVQNSRNQVKFDNPVRFLNYFTKCFGLQHLQRKYAGLKKRLDVAQRKMEFLQTIEDALQEERQKTIEFILIRLFRSEKIMQQIKTKIANENRAIKDLKAQMLDTARKNYFKSKAMIMGNYKADLKKREADLVELHQSHAAQQTKWHSIFNESKLDEIKLPVNPIVNEADRAKKYFSIDYSCLPKEKIDSPQELNKLLQETVNELNQLRKNWPNVNRMYPGTYAYKRLLVRQNQHNPKYQEVKHEIDRINNQLAEVTPTYTAEFKKNMAILSTNMDQMHKDTYQDPLRGLQLELMNEDDLEEGINITTYTKFNRNQYILQLSGGEKKLIELAAVFSMITLTKTPFVCLDNLDYNFHHRTFPHLLKFLNSKSENLCQIIFVARNSRLHKRVPHRIQVIDTILEAQGIIVRALEDDEEIEDEEYEEYA